jgi:hypothetical protein
VRVLSTRGQRLTAAFLLTAAVIAVTAAALPKGIRARALGWLARRPDRPAIRVDPSGRDFGRVKPLDTLEAVFTVVNQGMQPLTLEPPKASCGCQTPEIDRLELGPGESATLRVRQQVKANVGRFNNMVFVRSNDPETPELMLSMAGVVTKGVVVRPEPVFLGTIHPGEARTRIVEIEADDGVPFRINHAESGGSRVTLRAEKGPSRALHRIEVSFRDDGRIGPFEERIVVGLDRPGTPPLVIPVKGEVGGAVVAAPSALSLGHVPRFTWADSTLMVSSRAEPFAVTSVGILPENWNLKHSVEPAGTGGRRYMIRLGLRVPNVSGPLGAEVRVDVRFEGGKAASIVVPVTATASLSSSGTVPVGGGG